MIIEYLDTGSPDCPLVRMFDASGENLKRLSDIFRTLANSEVNEFEISTEEPIFLLIGLKKLIMSNASDSGATVISQVAKWHLSKANWNRAATIVDEIIDAPADQIVYNWLSGGNAVMPFPQGGVTILVSRTATGVW